MRILLLDCETAPNTASVWGLWQQNVSLNQLMESSYVLCWSAKWLGEKEVMFERVQYKAPNVVNKATRLTMLRKIHNLLSEADTIVHYNGQKFDVPTLNKEFILHGMRHPAPYKQVDLLRVARGQFKFASNKLDYVAQALNLGRKTRHVGHELWLSCMQGCPKAWRTMERYNRNDVILLEKVYYKLLPWIKSHANHNLFSDQDLVCPTCGSDQFQRRGLAHSKTLAYQRFQCRACGSWFRSAGAEKLPKAAMVSL